jgi:hypothetical protein
LVHYFTITLSQVNTTLVDLDLSNNKLDLKGGKALAKSLEVLVDFTHGSQIHGCCFCLQVNPSVTRLKLCQNRLLSEVGIVIAKSLRVLLFSFSIRRDGRLYFFLFPGEQEYHEPVFGGQPPRQRGWESSRAGP